MGRQARGEETSGQARGKQRRGWGPQYTPKTQHRKQDENLLRMEKNGTDTTESRDYGREAARAMMEERIEEVEEEKGIASGLGDSAKVDFLFVRVSYPLLPPCPCLITVTIV